MKIKQKVYSNILNAMKSIDLESGGILGAKKTTITTIDTFEYDRIGTANEYIPDVEKLNQIIKKWYLNDVFLWD